MMSRVRRDKQKQAQQQNRNEQDHGESQQKRSAARFADRFAARISSERFCLPPHCVDAPIPAFILLRSQVAAAVSRREFSCAKP